MTCRYRCGNACEHAAPNQSSNDYFGDLLTRAVSRRALLRGGTLGALVVGAQGFQDAATASPRPQAAAVHGPGDAGLAFMPVPGDRKDAVVVPIGYDHTVIIKWGDPVVPGAPPLEVDKQNGAAQAQQFGYNNDYVAVVPLAEHGRALLICNHEYTNPELMFPNYTGLAGLTDDEVRAVIEACGMSVVEIERVGDTGAWRSVGSGPRRYNRRVTRFTTRLAFTGPAVGDQLLRTAEDPDGRHVYGTLANCAGGVTPWGTVLSGEENFNFIFAHAALAPESLKPALARYGFDIQTPSAEAGWSGVDARLDMSKNPNEAHRFGWIVEIDPYDPHSVPRKHTALGRIKHEGASVVVSPTGRVAVYMGDDERFEYLYKFVSDRRYRRGESWADRAHNMRLLESGSLYVARLDPSSPGEIDGSGRLPADGAFNGKGQWIRLTRGGHSCVNGMTIAEVLVQTRLAADRVGATKLDRPEDIEIDPDSGSVFVALTNNTRRGEVGSPGVDEANPRSGNKHGHVLRIAEHDGDHSAVRFDWDIPVLCGDPADPSTYFLGYDKAMVSPISSPDNLAFDPVGNLWIATDSAGALGVNDGLFAMPVSGPEAGRLRRFLSVPVGAEATGPFHLPDGRTILVAVQHPGEVLGASYENPASRWPDGGVAKPGVVCVWRADGGRVGT